jgi:hypothetical protein
MDPVSDTNVLLAIQRGQFAMAGMKDCADRVAAVLGSSAPGTTSGGRESAGNHHNRAAHVAGMGRPLNKFEARNSRQHVDDATVDGDVRREAHMPV